MAMIQTASTQPTAVGVGPLLVRLVSRVEAMGLLQPASEPDEFAVDHAFDALAAAGIGSAMVARARRTGEAAALLLVLHAIEESPVPRPTLQHLAALLGLDTVARLVGISEVSARRYLGGDREVPDAVAYRLHTLALIVADLAGSYNDYGIRRWFERTRSALDGTTPSALLTGPWSPDDDRVQRVRRLAESLTAPLGT